ncbi:hypothetical protein Hanom_Chr04g00295411 [Helianthus anomalus]
MGTNFRHHYVLYSATTFLGCDIMFFLAIKSEGEARFPFQTHPNTTRVVITTLVFDGVFSTANWVISAADTDSVWAFIVWLGMRLCLCILVGTLASVFYLYLTFLFNIIKLDTLLP